MPKFNEKSALLLKTAIDSEICDPQELANIMGNAAAETRDFELMHEDVFYKSVDRLISQVRSADDRFTRDEIKTAVKSQDPVLLATILYENRPKIGNTEPGDGWKYLGRGYFQVTGRYNYEIFGKKVGADLVNHPELAADPILSAKLAVSYWKESVPKNARLDVTLAAKAINGEYNGLERRIAGAERWAGTITPELVKDIQTGKISLDQLSFHGWEPLKDGKLKPNERGMEIRELQHHLNDLGIADAKGRRLEPNGTFDKPTQQAVATFQRQLGMSEKSPVTAATLKAAEFYASAPEILRKPLQPVMAHELPDAFREPPERLPPGAPSHYRNDWLPRDAEGRPNYLHMPSTQPDRSADIRLERPEPAIPAHDVEDRRFAQLQQEMAELRRQLLEQRQAEREREDQQRDERQQRLASESRYEHTPASIDSKSRAEPSPVMPYSDPRHPEHRLYAELKERLPQASEDRLVQFTAACHMNGIEPDRLGRIVVRKDAAVLAATWPPGAFVAVDITTPPPTQEQAMQQVGAYDHQLALDRAQFMEQQRQINERGGPVLG